MYPTDARQGRALQPVEISVDGYVATASMLTKTVCS
jgi:hypothetical protein